MYHIPFQIYFYHRMIRSEQKCHMLRKDICLHVGKTQFHPLMQITFLAPNCVNKQAKQHLTGRSSNQMISFISLSASTNNILSLSLNQLMVCQFCLIKMPLFVTLMKTGTFANFINKTYCIECQKFSLEVELLKLFSSFPHKVQHSS